MLEKGLTGIPITDDKGYFTGLLTIKDLSHVIINEDKEELYTSYDNILHVLKEYHSFLECQHPCL